MDHLANYILFWTGGDELAIKENIVSKNIIKASWTNQYFLGLVLPRLESR